MNCDSCGSLATLRCAKCQVVYYCNSECQRKAWSTHKKTCHDEYLIKIDGDGQRVPATEEDVKLYFRGQSKKATLWMKVLQGKVEISEPKPAPGLFERLVIDALKRDVPTGADAQELARTVGGILQQRSTSKRAVSVAIVEASDVFRIIFSDFVVGRDAFVCLSAAMKK